MASTEQSPPGVGRTLTRRDFLGLGGRAGLEALRRGHLAGALSGQPEHTASPVGEIAIGSLEELAAMPPGTVSTQFAGSGRFYLVRVADGIIALDRRCPGQGCAVLWRTGLPALPADREQGWTTGQFVCLAHGAQFDRYGEPAPGRGDSREAMIRFPVAERQGQVVVHVAGNSRGGERPRVFPLSEDAEAAD